jgi:hypothetical protein
MSLKNTLLRPARDLQQAALNINRKKRKNYGSKSIYPHAAYEGDECIIE